MMTYAKLSGALLARKDDPPATSLAETVSVPNVAPVSHVASVPNIAPVQNVTPAPLAGDGARRLAHDLRLLKLPIFLAEYDHLARQCAAEGLDYSRFLLRLAEMEITERRRRLAERCIREARFPAEKTLDEFDFSALPALNRRNVAELAQCGYIACCENVIAIGNNGTGKTHIAIGLGMAACRRGMSVRFVTAASLVRQLLETHDQKRLLRLQERLAAYKLLIIDELGYVPFSTHGAELLFEVISQRYERGSTIVTSNLGFEEWTGVFGSERLADAVLDRLTHHVHILDMHGDNYRLKNANHAGAQP